MKKKNSGDGSLKTLALVIAIVGALSGWGAIAHSWLTSSPKIEGRVLNLLTFEWRAPPQFNKPKTGIMPYLYLINTRKNPVHILDYELEFDIGNGYEKALRVYGTRNLPQPTFGSGEFTISIPNFKDKLIYSKNTPIDYGTPVHGFAFFATDRSNDEIKAKIKSLKITCIDAFNIRHSFEYNPIDSANLYLLQDIADIDIKNDVDIDNRDK